jgi:hypothetical protein
LPPKNTISRILISYNNIKCPLNGMIQHNLPSRKGGGFMR